jgi:hypothetical protein
MTDHIDAPHDRGKKRTKGPLIATTIYGLLYLWFVIVSFIPAPEGNWINSTPYDPFDLDMIGIKLLFLLFLIGYFWMWKNEGIAGAIFLLWWVAMWCFEIFVVAPMRPDPGGGIAMGFPLFVLGILFVRRWYKGRSVEKVLPAP